MPEENNEEVKPNEQQGGQEDPSASEQPEPSGEVKPDSGDGTDVKTQGEPEPKESKEVDKYTEQIGNLNQALKKEREERRKEKGEFENKLSSSHDTIEKLRNVFVEPEDNDNDYEQQYLTKEEVEQLLDQKQQEIRKEDEDKKKSEMIKNEIDTLSKEFDGGDGKPKYDDDEVLEWQKKNNKLYLSPREAFYEAKRDEIIDFEVKQRLNKKKPMSEVEKPSTSPSEHEPNTKEEIPENEEDLKKHVREAMDAADAEM